MSRLSTKGDFQLVLAAASRRKLRNEAAQVLQIESLLQES